MSGDRGPTGRPQLEELVHRARTELRDWTDTADSDPGVALLQLLAFVGDLLSSHSERLTAEAYLGSGRRNKFEIEVDGHPWHQVTDLAGSGAEDPHYLVSRRHDGASVIEFGDGVHGRRPPSNSSIGVRYRHAGAYSSVLLQQRRVFIDTDVSEEPVRATCGVYRVTVLDKRRPAYATASAGSGSRLQRRRTDVGCGMPIGTWHPGGPRRRRRGVDRPRIVRPVTTDLAGSAHHQLKSTAGRFIPHPTGAESAGS